MKADDRRAFGWALLFAAQWAMPDKTETAGRRRMRFEIERRVFRGFRTSEAAG